VRARRIALFLRADQNDYQELLREDCHATAQRCDLSVRSLHGQSDADRQLHQIQECLNEPESARPSAILVFPVGDVGLRPLAYEAARLGIGWVTLNRTCDFMPELRREYPNLPLFCVSPDQRRVGRIQGKQMKALLPRGGKVVYIQGPAANSSAQLRLAGVQDEIEGSNLVLIPYLGDWSFAGGADEATRWLQTVPSNRPLYDCLVAAQNDAMAMGARTVVKRAAITRTELGTLHITGCDGTPTYGQRLVNEKQLTATVLVPSTSGQAVELVAAVLRGARPPTRDLSPDVSSFPAIEQLMVTPRRFEKR
jgi:ABC-type sugar transport system substrate-binding protein